MGLVIGIIYLYFRGGAFGFKLETLNKLTELKSNDNKKTLILFIVESVLEMQRPDLFDIKLKESNEDEITLTSCLDILKEVRKNFQSVSKLNDISKTINDPNDKSQEYLGTVT